MTEFSWPWACDNVGDGGSASFTLDVVEATNRLRTNLDPTGNGVIYWTDTTVLPFTGFVNASDGLLEPTNPAGNTIRIGSGLGLVQGWLYANDDDVDFDATGAANATDIIVLRRDRTGQTVRLALVQAGAGGTATVTQNATTWEVLIATIALDGSGNVSTLTDSRSLVKPPVGSITKLGEYTGDGTTDVATFNNIPPLFESLMIKATIRVAAAAVFWTIAGLRMNNDTGANYTYIFNQTNNTGNTILANVTNTLILLGGVTNAANSTAGAFTSLEILIPNYKNTNHYKNALLRVFSEGDSTLTANGITTIEGSGSWQNTSAITRLDVDMLGSNMDTGSTVTLYGIV